MIRCRAQGSGVRAQGFGGLRARNVFRVRTRV